MYLTSGTRHAALLKPAATRPATVPVPRLWDVIAEHRDQPLAGLINVAKGISGIAYGSRPAPVTDIDLAELTAVATSWIGEYFSRFEKQIADREGHLVGSGPFLAALGAMGQELLTLRVEDRAARQPRALGVVGPAVP